MPPKKKKGGRKKAKDDGEITLEDKYKKALEEIEMLKEHLAVRKELARRSQAASEEWKVQMQEAEKTLDEHASAQLSVNADISRQYKTMQHEMEIKNTTLEMDVRQLSKSLGTTKAELKKTQDEMKKVCEDKNVEIKSYRLKIDSMGTQYESVLMDSLDRMAEKMDTMRDQWKKTTLNIQEHNKNRLLEFGLNPLEF